MTFSSFFKRLLLLLVLTIGLFHVTCMANSGAENIFIFAIGVIAACTIVQWFDEDTGAVFPIPAGRWGRAGVLILALVRLTLLVILVEHEHFFVGTLVALVSLFNWSAFNDVLKTEQEIKETMVRASAAAFAAPLERTDANVATLDKLSEPDNRVGFKPAYPGSSYGGTALGQP